MTSPDITPDELEEWKVMCAFPRTIAFEQLARTALPALIAAYERAVRDIEAYRGSLGYSVSGDHNGLLSDGTLPTNGIAEALTARVAEVEQENVQLRDTVQYDAYRYLTEHMPIESQVAVVSTLRQIVRAVCEWVKALTEERDALQARWDRFVTHNRMCAHCCEPKLFEDSPQ